MSKEGKRNTYCLSCRTTYARQWARDNQHKQAAYKRQKTYGLSEEDYEDLILTQRSACAICYTMDRKLIVDHCHDCGEVRGLLCGPCNRALGVFGDDPVMLQRATDYVNGKKVAPW